MPLVLRSFLACWRSFRRLIRGQARANNTRGLRTPLQEGSLSGLWRTVSGTCRLPDPAINVSSPVSACQFLSVEKDVHAFASKEFRIEWFDQILFRASRHGLAEFADMDGIGHDNYGDCRKARVDFPEDG